MNLDEVKIGELKVAVRPNEWDEKGCVRAIIKDDLYPDLEVQSVTPRYYYSKKYHDQDEYSAKILYTKSTCKDESAYFIPFVEDCINKFQSELDLQNIDLIGLIPNGDNKYYLNIIEVAKFISKKLKKHLFQLLDRTSSQKSVSRGRQSRYTDLHGKFKIHEGVSVSGKTVLLIDDIRTSGISVLECSQVLTNADVSRVLLFALGTNTSNEPPKKR